MDMDISTFHIKSVDCGNVVQFGWPRVCLSVRPSDRSRYCIKMAKRRITQTTQHDSSFLTPKVSGKFKIGNCRPISRCVRNNARYGYSYNGRL